MRGAGHRLLRELAPRDALAARLRDRQSRRLADYGDELWGLTACDGPLDATLDDRRAQARGSGPTRRAAPRSTRSATTARSRRPPPAARSRSRPRSRSRRWSRCARRYGDALFGQYGFLDAFNPTFAGRARAAARAQVVPGRRLVRHRLSRHRPGADPAMIENHRIGPRLALHAQEPAHHPRAAARRVHRRMARAGADVAMMLATTAGRRSAGARCAAASSGSRAASRRGERRDGHPALLGLRPRGRGGPGAGPASSSAQNPGIRVQVQQIPWTAAHEKLLTAYVGDATPDVAQLGNTWIPEFAALGALEPLDALDRRAPTVVDSADYFPASGTPTSIDDTVYGMPWYVDTRVLFYRKDLLARAGYAAMPTTWAEWRTAMEAVKRQRRAPAATRSSCRPTSGPQPYDLRPAGRLDAARRRRPLRRVLATGVPPGVRVLRRPLPRRARAGARQHRDREPLPGVRPRALRHVHHRAVEPRRVPRRLPAELQDDWATAPLPGARRRLGGRVARRRLEPRRCSARPGTRKRPGG